MNHFNRIVIAIEALLLAVGGAFVAAGIWGLLSPSDVALFPGLGSIVQRLGSLQGAAALWTAIGGVGAAAIGLLLLFLEIWVPPTTPEYLLRQDKTGRTSVSVGGLKRLADHVLSEIPGVETVSSEPRPGRDGVSFRCRVIVKPDSNVPYLSEQIRERLADTLKKHIEQPTARTRVDVYAQVGRPSSPNGRRRVQ